MPYAVTHFLIPLLLASFLRDYIISKKNKKHFPLHYVLIAGIAGVLPDIDLLFFLGLYLLGYGALGVHRTITHSLVIPLFFVLIGICTTHLKNRTLGKNNLRIHYISYMIAFGVFMHIFLDGLLIGTLMPFYPFSTQTFGLDLVHKLPFALQNLALPLFDGVVLVLWLCYLEIKHKISDFI